MYRRAIKTTAAFLAGTFLYGQSFLPLNVARADSREDPISLVSHVSSAGQGPELLIPKENMRREYVLIPDGFISKNASGLAYFDFERRNTMNIFTYGIDLNFFEDVKLLPEFHFSKDYKLYDKGEERVFRSGDLDVILEKEQLHIAELMMYTAETIRRSKGGLRDYIGTYQTDDVVTRAKDPVWGKPKGLTRNMIIDIKDVHNINGKEYLYGELKGVNGNSIYLGCNPTPIWFNGAYFFTDGKSVPFVYMDFRGIGDITGIEKNNGSLIDIMPFQTRFDEIIAAEEAKKK